MPNPRPGLMALISVCLVLLVPTGCDRGAPGTVGRPAANRVVPANAAVLDYLGLLGAFDRVVALPRTAREYSNLLPEDAGSLPVLADFRSEAILALSPDLVVADETQSPETRESLRSYGVEVLLLEPHRDIAAGNRNLERLAARLGLDAAPVVSELRRRERMLRDRKPIEAGPTVLCLSRFGDALWCAGAETGEDWAIDLAGARNHAALLGFTGHRPLPLELLLARPPDVLLLSSTAQLEALQAHERIGRLEVLRQERVVILSPALASADSPCRLDAAAALRDGLLRLGLVKE